LETVAGEGKAPRKEEKPKSKEKQAVKETVSAEPKSGTLATEAPVKEEAEVLAQEQVLPVTAEPGEAEPVELFKPEIKKLSGLTVVGKIDLPVEEKKKPGQYQQVNIEGESDFRRKKKRKRIS